jgi:hypothetical protein
MEQDQLKSDWEHIHARIEFPPIKRVMVPKYAVLRQLHLQLVLDSIAWVLLIIVLYAFTDEKIIKFRTYTMIMVLITIIFEYLNAKWVINEKTVTVWLKSVIKEKRFYIITSTILRLILILYLAGIIITSTIPIYKYILTAIAVALMLIKTYMQYRTWLRRLRPIEKIIKELEDLD